MLAKLHPNTKWFSFEPNLNILLKLSHNLLLNGIDNVQLFNFAIGNVSGLKRALIPKNHPGLSTLSKKVSRFDSDLADENLWAVTTLDKILSREKQVNLIKLDIEGCEYLALKGARKLLSSHRPILFFEANDQALGSFNSSLNQLKRFLRRLDYIITDDLDGDLVARPHL